MPLLQTLCHRAAAPRALMEGQSGVVDCSQDLGLAASEEWGLINRSREPSWRDRRQGADCPWPCHVEELAGRSTAVRHDGGAAETPEWPIKGAAQRRRKTWRIGTSQCRATILVREIDGVGPRCAGVRRDSIEFGEIRRRAASEPPARNTICKG